MGLTESEKKWLHDYESKSDEELALLSVYSGEGLDSKNRAAIAKFILDRRNAQIRDGREERTLQQAERALKIAEETKNAAKKQVYASYAALFVSIISLAISAFPRILTHLF